MLNTTSTQSTHNILFLFKNVFLGFLTLLMLLNRVAVNLKRSLLNQNRRQGIVTHRTDQIIDMTMEEGVMEIVMGIAMVIAMMIATHPVIVDHLICIVRLTFPCRPAIHNPQLMQA